MHQIACRAGPLIASLIADSGPVALLVAALACWIVAITRVTRSSMRPRHGRDAQGSSGVTGAVDDEPSEDAWFPPHRSPVDEGPQRRGIDASGWFVTDRRHRTPVQVVEPAHVAGTTTEPGDTVAAAMLDDLAGAVLHAGWRGHRRSWGGVLLHGADASETAQLAAGLAAVHDVPMLIVRTHDIVPVDQRPVVEPVVTLAESMAPCILLVEGLDDLTDPGAPLVVSRHARRIEHELATAVRTADRTVPIAILGSAHAADAVARSLLQDGCFDRVVVVGTATRRQRALLLQTELLHHDALFDDALEEAVRLTDGMRRHEILGAVHWACRLARQRAPDGTPVVVSSADLRAALHHALDHEPLAIGLTHEARVRGLVDIAHDPATSPGLVLAGDPDNGGAEVARWIASRTRRSVKWIDGDALDAVPAEDIGQLFASGLDDLPVVVVWNHLDRLLSADTANGRRRKSVLATIERLAQTPGMGIIATTREPTLLDPALIDDGTLEVMWIGAPRLHDRVALLSHELGHAVLADTTVEELAASLVGATRAQVIARCRAALRSSLLRNGQDCHQPLEIVRADFR